MKHEIFGISSNGNEVFDEHFKCVSDNGSTCGYISNDKFLAILGRKNVYFRLYAEIMDSVEYDETLNAINVQLTLIPEYKSLNPKYRKRVLEETCENNIENVKNDLFYYEALHGEGIEVVLGYEAIKYENGLEEVCDYPEAQKALAAIANTYQTVGQLIGFYLDRYVNRIGNTGWDYLDYFCGRRNKL